MPLGKTALTPALITLFAVLAFLTVLNFAITPTKTTNQNESTNNANLANGNTNSANTNTDRTLVTNANAANNTNTTANTNTTSNTNAVTDPIAGWETYTNSNFGASGDSYNFRYPSDWIVGDYDKQYVRISPPNQTTNEQTTPVTISVDYIVVPGTIPAQSIDDPSDVMIGGKPSKQGIQNGTPDVFITHIPVTGGILQISWVKNDSDDTTQRLITSTFTFTN